MDAFTKHRLTHFSIFPLYFLLYSVKHCLFIMPHAACVLPVTFCSPSLLSVFLYLYPAADAAAGGPHGCQSRRLPDAQHGLSHHPDPPDGGAQYQQPATHPHDPCVGWVSSDTGWATALHFLSYGMGCEVKCYCHVSRTTIVSLKLIYTLKCRFISDWSCKSLIKNMFAQSD